MPQIKLKVLDLLTEAQAAIGNFKANGHELVYLGDLFDRIGQTITELKNPFESDTDIGADIPGGGAV